MIIFLNRTELFQIHYERKMWLYLQWEKNCCEWGWLEGRKLGSRARRGGKFVLGFYFFDSFLEGRDWSGLVTAYWGEGSVHCLLEVRHWLCQLLLGFLKFGKPQLRRCSSNNCLRSSNPLALGPAPYLRRLLSPEKFPLSLFIRLFPSIISQEFPIISSWLHVI